jgi:hypothetical protein
MWWLRLATRVCVCACLVFRCTREHARACVISGMQRLHAWVPARCSNIALMPVRMFGDTQMHTHACACLRDQCLQRVHARVPGLCSNMACMLVRMLGDAQMHTHACACLCDQWLSSGACAGACVVLKHCCDACVHVEKRSIAHACMRVLA